MAKEHVLNALDVLTLGVVVFNVLANVERVWDMGNDRVSMWTRVKRYSTAPDVCFWDGKDACEAYCSHSKCIRYHITIVLNFSILVSCEVLIVKSHYDS